MLGFFHPPSKAEHERARIWAAGALAALALLMLMLLIGRPPRVDLTPPPLRAELMPYFRDHLNACRGALAAAGFQTRVVPDLSAAHACGYNDAVALDQADGSSIQASCALAAGIALWRRDVVEPAAQRYYGQSLRALNPLGGPYSCRRIAGRTDGRMSEHAHANAIDVGGFTLTDGRTITVVQGWRAPTADSAFLHTVRTGGCRIFQGVLSPDYNRAHANHLHLDMGAYRICH